MWRSIFNSCKIVFSIQILASNGLNKEPHTRFVVGTATEEEILKMEYPTVRYFPGDSLCVEHFLRCVTPTGRCTKTVANFRKHFATTPLYCKAQRMRHAVSEIVKENSRYE